MTSLFIIGGIILGLNLLGGGGSPKKVIPPAAPPPKSVGDQTTETIARAGAKAAGDALTALERKFEQALNGGSMVDSGVTSDDAQKLDPEDK